MTETNEPVTPECCYACHALCGVEITTYSWRDRALWIGAAVAVLTFYGAAAVAAIALRNQPEPVGAPPAAVMVEYAPAPAAPRLEKKDVALGPQMEERAASQASDAKDAPEENLKELVEAEGSGEEVVLNDSKEFAEDAEQKVASLVESQSQADEVKAIDPTIPDVVEAENPDVVVPEATASSAAPESAKMVKPSAASVASEATLADQPEVQEEIAEVAMAPNQTETSMEVANLPVKWQTKLLAYLEKHKSYPAAARSKRQTGVVNLHFKIDGAGRVMMAEISKSSGYPALDNAVMELIEKASPVPAPPGIFAQTGVELTVPVRFQLR
ncbi:energy transducer TonB [Methyloligella solikamskensis]|uniref:TonB family protein n=1 Tax=Methyloligella solikamskensis TaxID=1177756 RepID=A0ABW3JES1_9HYPH